MRNFSKIYAVLLVFLLVLTGCEREGIDPITRVEPGADQGAPVITINYPREGTVISEPEELSTIEIDLKVQDDIELGQIVVEVNGEEVATYNEFPDYRIALKKIIVEGLAIGQHTLTVTATDIEGKVTTQTINFSKEPPYIPVYANEIFYMPFDADFMEFIGLRTAGSTGDPGISGDAAEGTGAYLGAPNSYLTIPLEDLGDEFSIAFWYNMDVSADRAGILTATDDSDRNQGFRLFREAQGAEAQVIKLNVGTGESDIWNDGGNLAVDSGWTHITFTVAPTGTAIYFDGVLVRATELDNVFIDWTGVENLIIGSGLNFSGWGHNSDDSLIDELRIFDVAMTPEEVMNMVNPPVQEISLHIPFNNSFEDLISNRNINVVGNPSFTDDSAEGESAYSGAEGAYLTFPANGLTSSEFSATFWYKVNASPDRAGIITISAEDPNNPNAPNNRTKGLRLFREGSATEQTIKLNVGTGAADSWNDGGVIDATAGEWVHVAFTISETETHIYFNGELARKTSLPSPIDWTGADQVSIMSGAPRFTEWNHLSDQSFIDDLRFYTIALTEEEIKADMAN